MNFPFRLAAAAVIAAHALAGALIAPPEASAAGFNHVFCRTYEGGAASLLLNHALTRAQRGPKAASVAEVSQSGEVVVVRDRGDLIRRANPLDLQGRGIEFRPGYTATALPQPLGPDGTPFSLGDDATGESPLPFAFPFFGVSYDRVFINSDGNLTFGRGDPASTPRDLSRLVSGAPRIAPLLADLDPSAGGSVTTTSTADAFVVKWTTVPQFGIPDKNTFQVSLHPDGRIVFAYDTTNLTTAIEEGVVGISAGGGAAGLSIVDLSATAGTVFERSIAEAFNLEVGLDLAGVTRAVYSVFPDNFDQIVVYTSRGYIPRSQGAFAFENTVRNAISGIGASIGDSGAALGSASRLSSVVMMDRVEKYSTNVATRVLREETSLSVLAHEVGHRWLTQARYNDGTGVASDLLGRQQAHWSFYVHSSGSHDEGNDFQDLGGGLFRSGPSSARYGPLDQYLMGIRTPGEVPPVFIITNPVHDGEQSAERAPETAVEIRGTRKDVPVSQVIAALGERSPAAQSAGATPWKIAFVYVTEGVPEDATYIATVDTLRSQFETFFVNSTEGRWSVDTRLR